jgi:hypothetical protein
MRATQLPFIGVPGLPSHQPSTSVMLRGVDGLRVDVLSLLRESFRDAPSSLRKATLSRLVRIAALLAEHPQAAEAFRGLR